MAIYLAAALGSDASPQMAFRERDAGAAFQIALKSPSACLVGEDEDGVDAPRAVLSRMGTVPSVVSGQPCRDMRRQSGVVARWIGDALQDVHACLWSGHASADCKPGRREERARRRASLCSLG